MSAIFDVHLKLMSMLPVRTHEQRRPETAPPQHRTALPRHQIRTFAKLRAAKLYDREILRSMRISKITLQRLKDALKSGK